jgi:hypothetical protein
MTHPTVSEIIMNTKVDEGKLISGKEALIALANGESVQCANAVTLNWSDVDGDCHIDLFTTAKNRNGFDFVFRLKPHTIKINEIEVPACGVDYKPHTFMFVLNSLEPCEYSKIILDESDEIPPYWWSTEEEIKQVVAALRQVFGGSHDN